jgi:hypothetical protein
VAVFTYVGNLGCIRFPPVVRAAAGVKRGDRLAVSARGRHALLLEKLPVGLSLAELEVAGCACQSAPEGCSHGDSHVVTVGWSYVQLDAALANHFGFLPGRPIKMVAQPSQIAVSVHRNRRDLEGVPEVACPP